MFKKYFNKYAAFWQYNKRKIVKKEKVHASLTTGVLLRFHLKDFIL